MSQTNIDLQIALPPETRYLSLVGNIAELLVKEISEYSGDRDLLAFHLNLVLTEAMANVIQHAPTDETQQTLQINIRVEGKQLCIRVFDQGQGFDLEQTGNICGENLNESGRGIFVIRSIMDSVDYRKLPSGNVLEMNKNLAKSG